MEEARRRAEPAEDLMANDYVMPTNSAVVPAKGLAVGRERHHVSGSPHLNALAAVAGDATDYLSFDFDKLDQALALE